MSRLHTARPAEEVIRTDDRTDAWPLACPVCDAGLCRTKTSLVCSVGHSFDVAKEGYVNLMPSAHRSRGIDGDTQEMVQARRRFLEVGHYRQLLERLETDVAELLRDSAGARRDPQCRACVLEVGCGEGHYLGNLARSRGAVAEPNAVFMGADVSKPAVRLAARHFPEATFFVADVNRRIYVRDASVRILLDVFAPRNPVEFDRIVEPGGAALIVIPSPTHLHSLRTDLGLLGVQDDKEAKVLQRLGAGFSLVDRSELSYPIELQSDAMRDLVNMGPNRWHAPDLSAGRGSASLMTEASFVILQLRRHDEAR